mmetsp:Transcript_47501/g.152197  ORF Transcript_47501/g.152197 Transcript_47501/m.152197 type:complete len:318 (+) Transcript_47501:336-1289(+)
MRLFLACSARCLAASAAVSLKVKKHSVAQRLVSITSHTPSLQRMMRALSPTSRVAFLKSGSGMTASDLPASPMVREHARDTPVVTFTTRATSYSPLVVSSMKSEMSSGSPGTPELPEGWPRGLGTVGGCPCAAAPRPGEELPEAAEFRATSSFSMAAAIEPLRISAMEVRTRLFSSGSSGLWSYERSKPPALVMMIALESPAQAHLTCVLPCTLLTRQMTAATPPVTFSLISLSRRTNALVITSSTWRVQPSSSDSSATPALPISPSKEYLLPIARPFFLPVGRAISTPASSGSTVLAGEGFLALSSRRILATCSLQ